MTGTSLAAQMKDNAKWMSPECYPLISQLAGVFLWSFLYKASEKFFGIASFFHFYWIRNYILFSKEHIILS